MRMRNMVTPCLGMIAGSLLSGAACAARAVVPSSSPALWRPGPVRLAPAAGISHPQLGRYSPAGRLIAADDDGEDRQGDDQHRDDRYNDNEDENGRGASGWGYRWYPAYGYGPGNYGDRGNYGTYGNRGNYGTFGNRGPHGNYGDRGNYGDYGGDSHMWYYGGGPYGHPPQRDDGYRGDGD